MRDCSSSIASNRRMRSAWYAPTGVHYCAIGSRDNTCTHLKELRRVLEIYTGIDTDNIGGLANMLLAKALRSPCVRQARRPQGLYNAAFTSHQSKVGSHPSHPRVLTTTHGLRADQKASETIGQQSKIPNAASHTTKQSDAPTDAKLIAGTKSTSKKDNILSTSTATNKEQRKADWAIMKEMAKYLWPKVWSCSNCSKAVWLSLCRVIGAQSCVSEQLSHYLSERR